MWSLQLECVRDEVEAVSNCLENQGACSVSYTDQYDSPIMEPELGTMPLWPHVVITALFDDENMLQSARMQLSSTFVHLTPISHSVPDKDWVGASLKHFKPLQFGKRLWVCPSWEELQEKNAVSVILDPGLAFGTGSHPTTSLCLSWLDKTDVSQQEVVDYGCGSGILAIACAKLGAGKVYAVDIDSQALTATMENAKNNAIDKRQLSVSFPEALTIQQVDLLIANILLSPLIELKLRFLQLIKSDGRLVLSGIMISQVEALILAYESHFTHQGTETNGDWALLIFTPKKKNG